METFSRETLPPWFVTGFVDGEGTFTYSRSGRQMGLYFAIKLTGDELPLLQRLQQFFGGFGKIYKVIARTPKAYGGFTKTAFYFRITRQSDLLRVIEHFDSYPLHSSKANSYRIWREMVLLKTAFRKPDRERLNALAAELSASCIRKQTRR